MAKRFTDTDKYKKPFIRGLKGAYKLLWDYLYHDCNHAGIWIVDFEIAQIYLGSDMPVNYQDALKFFNEGEERIIQLNGGRKWFVRPFVYFQYGALNENNKVHASVMRDLKKCGLDDEIIMGLTSPLQGAKDKDKEKDKEKEKKSRNTSINHNKKKSPAQELLSYFGEVFKKNIGHTYMASFQKEVPLMKKVLAVYSLDQSKDLVDAFFIEGRADHWVSDKMTVGVFYTQINQLVVRLRQGKITLGDEDEAKVV